MKNIDLISLFGSNSFKLFHSSSQNTLPRKVILISERLNYNLELNKKATAKQTNNYFTENLIREELLDKVIL